MTISLLEPLNTITLLETFCLENCKCFYMAIWTDDRSTLLHIRGQKFVTAIMSNLPRGTQSRHPANENPVSCNSGGIVKCWR